MSKTINGADSTPEHQTTKCPRCKGKGTVITLLEGAYYWVRGLSRKTWGIAQWDGYIFIDSDGPDGAYEDSEVEIGPMVIKPKELK